MVKRSDIRDTDLSIHFRHGNHTILLFVDSMATFSHIQEELLEILKERYPDGITTSAATPQKTELPNDASQIKFGVLKNKTDATQGWNPLVCEPDDTPADKGFEDNMMVAFAIASDDADDIDDVNFEVEFPSYEEEADDIDVDVDVDADADDL